MSETPVITAPTIEPNTDTIVPRMAVPFFSFSVVLFVSLLASQTFLLPRLTTFTVGNVNVSVDEALVYERQLRAEVISLEDERDALVLPYIDDAHDALMKEKRSTPTVIDLRKLVEDTMRHSVEKVGASVSVDAVLYEHATKTVTVRGSVTDPNPSSMTTLSTAVDAVRALLDIADLTSPALTREPIEGGGYRSPFKFSFTLQ